MYRVSFDGIFFEKIIDLCIWINKAKGEIHNKNAQLVDILREYRDLEIIKRMGDEYLRKDIELFCEFDRERIKELSGIQISFCFRLTLCHL